jgi:hypothetical protein
MSLVFIPVSVGELCDKITILSIKQEKIEDPHKKFMIEHELNHLHVEQKHEIEPQFELLKTINNKLWDLEDRIREKESKSEFDNEFIEIARSIYKTNDERSRIKQEINHITKSELTDIKNYAEYV